MYQCPHLTSLRAKTGIEQELSWMLFVCVCVFKAVFAFQGCCSVIKRRGTKEEGRGKEKGAKPLFSKERRLLVGDAALIRRTVAVDNHDHRGQSVNSNRPVGIFKVCEAGKENVYCCCTKKQE